jgi:hypothetical protein
MEERHPIDNVWRERLGETEVQAPDFVWPLVEDRLRKKKRRFLFLWFLVGGIAVAGLLGRGTHNVQNRQLAETVKRPNVQPVQTTASGVPDLEQATSTYKTTERSGIEKGKETTGKRRFVAKNVLFHDVSVQPMANPTLVSNEHPTAVPTATSANMETTSVSAAATTADIAEASTVVDLSMDGTGDKTLAVPTVENSAPIRTLVPGMTALHRPVSLLPMQKAVARPLVFAPKKPKTFARRKRPNKHCYDFARNSSVWVLDAYIGPSLAKKQLRTTPDNKPYLYQRLNSEQNSLSLNAGLRVSYLFNKNFLLRSGIQYDQVNEVFEYIDPKYTKYNIVSYVGANGQQFIDTVSIEFGENYLKTFNRLGFLDIPFQGAYEMRVGRGGMSLNGGVSFNVLFRKRGAMRTPQGDAAYFTPSRADAVEVFRPRLGLSVVGSVQWFYYMEPRTRVFIEPYYRKIMGPVNLLSHPVEQRYGIGGLRMGITRIMD